jgi:hypothetical protein
MVMSLMMVSAGEDSLGRGNSWTKKTVREADDIA